ncbi:ATP-binding protein [Tenacibaculum maritimum]|uniref:histidine kinase n=1 Tax=Tenacibaculum maritimum NCIMB 2154 TaxID=1349785 RepID=A0A2H1E8H6_9FLAO|nr:HAMP domain-containing sensor histidine kinase [Tenacibaculum maritimum]MCD9561980.1 HAMP domain-containing histidine kinase [Tenacibaculum maritimum]MCD9565064.1 HAMP domain-containing histidine kinase [Tenacibaculum maritimum]MCD9579037.1 HAMP domain-containing histidine kinase [Tenacibaculum maritimum]MCD9582670.1 HAMP domain-containing histidine kinase [Tenacibaculum maritimum]MCD9583857.1 HAMP domain-containing histidine kinase [Tenacibaculum maritimum]
MSFFKNILWLKRIAILISFSIVSLILWNTYVFFQKFKKEERSKMELFAASIKEFATNPDLNKDTNLNFKIYDIITDIPLILVDKNDEIISFENLDSIQSLRSSFLQEKMTIMKSQNEPILIEFEGITQKIYYGNSNLLNKLTYYPIALILIMVLFLSVIYMFFSSTKVAEQNKLWTGMAKETAHQIGTPLSSLLGWIEILKTENIDASYITEMQKDIDRLSTIANRFSKIGSVPKLDSQNIVTITKAAFDYLKSRSSKKITFSFITTKNNLQTNLNTELYGWVIENLVKNAIDAMQGKGILTLSIKEYDQNIKITISDTGKGIPKSKFKQVFTPGFTTKKRGWGLGLSLSKRIINDYHNGKISILKSELNKGTTFQILLHKN